MIPHTGTSSATAARRRWAGSQRFQPMNQNHDPVQRESQMSLKLSVGVCLCLALLAGCSTPSDHIGARDTQLKVGRKYTLRTEAIIVANRGLINSIENPDHRLQDYKPYEDYDPYYTM